MNFTIYSKENCPYCYKVKQVLELTGSNFVVYTLDEDFTREEFYSKFGKGSTFPQVICNEERLGGSVDTIRFLKEQQVIKS
jgi:glutaredoxin